MKVLVYGEGWIGNQVIEQLKKLNHQVVLGKIRAEDMDGLEQPCIKNIKLYNKIIKDFIDFYNLKCNC